MKFSIFLATPYENWENAIFSSCRHMIFILELMDLFKDESTITSSTFVLNEKEKLLF